MHPSTSRILPAHQTKHIPLLRYPFRSYVFDLRQLDNGATNGSALWLGAQCLSLYLDGALKHKSRADALRPRAIELGSGIGLSALALSAMGWDVWATDLPDVISSVLMANVVQNAAHLPLERGSIHVRALDWTVPPDQWTWGNPDSIASKVPPSTSQKLDAVVPPGPPFDIILTSDTLYSRELAEPLLRALHALSTLSDTPACKRPPPIYLCVERRDPALIDHALHEARDKWSFSTERIPHKRVMKAMERGGVRWHKDDWEGVEIWRLTLNQSTAE